MNKEIKEYIEILKRDLLYGTFYTYGDVEGYIDDAYKKFLSKDNERNEIITKIVVAIDEYTEKKDEEIHTEFKERYIGVICGLKKALDIIKESDNGRSD